MPAPIALDFTDDERLAFWSRIKTQAGVVKCWLMYSGRGVLSGGGYGTHVYRGVHIPAHRLAYAMAYGVDPGPLMVLHSCDEPVCKNPRHLRLGTCSDNAADNAVAKLMERMHAARGRHAVRPTARLLGKAA